jgi:predicted nucleic acid-binding Zn ribbon protein
LVQQENGKNLLRITKTLQYSLVRCLGCEKTVKHGYQSQNFKKWRLCYTCAKKHRPEYYAKRRPQEGYSPGKPMVVKDMTTD